MDGQELANYFMKSNLPSKASEKLFSKLFHAITGQSFYDDFTPAGKEMIDKLLSNIIEGKNQFTQEQFLLIEKFLNASRAIKEGARLEDFLGEMISLNIVEESDPNNIDDDWFVVFWEKYNKVADESIRKLFSKTFEAELESHNTVSKRLLNTIFLLSTQDIRNINRLRRFCFNDLLSKQGRLHPVIHFRDYFKAYNNSNITSEGLHSLEQLGLIECDYSSGYIIENKCELSYTKYFLEITAKRIPMGNIRLTNDGNNLMSILSKETLTYDKSVQILEFTIAIWTRKGCRVIERHSSQGKELIRDYPPSVE